VILVKLPKISMEFPRHLRNLSQNNMPNIHHHELPIAKINSSSPKETSPKINQFSLAKITCAHKKLYYTRQHSIIQAKTINAQCLRNQSIDDESLEILNRGDRINQIIKNIRSAKATLEKRKKVKKIQETSGNLNNLNRAKTIEVNRTLEGSLRVARIANYYEFFKNKLINETIAY